MPFTRNLPSCFAAILAFLVLSDSCAIDPPVRCKTGQCTPIGTCDDSLGFPICICPAGYREEGLQCVEATVTGADCRDLPAGYCEQGAFCFFHNATEYENSSTYCTHDCSTPSDCPLDDRGLQMCCGKQLKDFIDRAICLRQLPDHGCGERDLGAGESCALDLDSACQDELTCQRYMDSDADATCTLACSSNTDCAPWPGTSCKAGNIYWVGSQTWCLK